MLKIIRFERYVFAIVMTVVMFLIAEITGQKEVIFPEIVAVMIGAWIAERQPWSVNKRKMFLLISISSVIGMLTVKYLHIPLLFQIMACFLSTGILLLLTKTTFIPIISACILPVYLQTDSWVYPVSVTTMALIIITAQWLMEKNHIRPKNKYVSKDFDFRVEMDRWIKLLVIFMIIAVIPIESRNIFLLAPPLIVVFAEFSNVKSPLRKTPFQIYGILVFAAVVGSVLRLLLHLYLDLPLVLCAMVSCVLLFLVFDFVHIKFAPAGAVLLLPMILPASEVKLFPLEVAIGSAILIFAAMFLFKRNEVDL